jgi:hypothetical protein
MTTVELISRVARRARSGGDFTKLSMLERMDVLSAINGAIQEVYELLPVYLKEQTLGFTLPAQVTVPALGVTNGSKVVTGYAFTADQIGRSILIEGDGVVNQLLGNGTNLSLLNDYQGQTGTVGATIYGDTCYTTGVPFDRIVGNPEYGDQRQWPIMRRTGNPSDYQFFGLLQVGRPMYWWVQNMGNSQGNVPILVMKFFPMPDTAYTVKVRIAFWARRLVLADYDDASTITVLDQFLESALIPLALRQFMLSPAWERLGPQADQDVRDSAARAEVFLRKQPGQVGAPANQVGTPFGY